MPQPVAPPTEGYQRNRRAAAAGVHAVAAEVAAMEEDDLAPEEHHARLAAAQASMQPRQAAALRPLASPWLGRPSRGHLCCLCNGCKHHPLQHTFCYCSPLVCLAGLADRHGGGSAAAANAAAHAGHADAGFRCDAGSGATQFAPAGAQAVVRPASGQLLGILAAGSNRGTGIECAEGWLGRVVDAAGRRAHKRLGGVTTGRQGGHFPARALA